MTDADAIAFSELFNGLRGVFFLRAEKAEVEQLVRTYFRALSDFTIESVEAGAKEWLVTGTKFPKPAEWRRAIPRGKAMFDELSPADAREYFRALAKRFEDDPCNCVSCRLASVSHRMIRFVPEYDENGNDVRVRIGEQVITRGHWAHGDELAAFYRARDEYMALKHTVGIKVMEDGSTATRKQIAEWREERRDAVVDGRVVDDVPDHVTEPDESESDDREWESIDTIQDGEGPEEPETVDELSMESEWE